jgi:hypothetical protein
MNYFTQQESAAMRTTIRDVLPDQYRRQEPEAKMDYIAGTPLVYCIEQFGGVVAFAKAINRSTRQIYRWRNGGGLISSEAQTEAMLAAKRLGVPLDAAKLVYMPPVMPENRAEEPENADEPA